ncbi:MAG: GTP-binding protein [Mariprofundaceae bacterium]
MQVRVFSAARLHEALALVRQSLGPDAVILDRRESKDTQGNTIWSVHAAIDAESSPAPKVREKPAQAAPVTSGSQVEHSVRRLERIIDGLGRQETASLRITLQSAASQRAFDTLMKLGVAPNHAVEIADSFADREPVCKELLHWGDKIDPKKRRDVVLFSGPSGCGKTTMLAKLATHFSMKGVKVALMSTDTARIGGMASLKPYAEMLGVPLFPLHRIEDVKQALHKTRDAGLVLVDSESWSSRNMHSLQRQNEIWQALPISSRLLVLPATMDEADGMAMIALAERYEMMELALSKLDEATRPGKLINWAATQIALSYCSYGSEVPEKIGWFTPTALTALLASYQNLEESL